MDARCLYTKVRRRRRPATDVADIRHFIIEPDQLEEHYSEATRKFIHIMEKSVFAENTSDAGEREDDEDDRAQAACGNCERTFRQMSIFWSGN
jgi:hypothetical protein